MREGKAAFAVVILAAGESKRFGSPKQLADFNNEPLLIVAIKKVLACHIVPYIALGANIEYIAQHQAMLPYQQSIIGVKNWKDGLSAAIKESIAFFEGKGLAGIVFLLGDQPLINIGYLRRFFNNIESFSSSLICTEYSDVKGDVGIPAYFPQAYFEVLTELEGDQGAKNILKNNKAVVLTCEGSLIDIDEPEDLAHARLMLI